MEAELQYLFFFNNLLNGWKHDTLKKPTQTQKFSHSVFLEHILNANNILNQFQTQQFNQFKKQEK